MLNIWRKFFYFTLLLVIQSSQAQFEPGPEIPSHMPSPQAAPEPPPQTPRQNLDGSGMNVGGFFGGAPPFPPPPLPPPPPIPPPELAPFGLKNIILILVPQFKTKWRRLPTWLTSSIKISMPITVFFDKLHVPPEFLKPPIVPPFGFPFPPPGQLPPPGPLPPSSAITAPGLTPANPLFSGLGWYPFFPNNFNQEDADTDDDSDADMDNDGIGGDSYYSPYEDENGKRRRKRRSVAFNKTLHATERAVLLPKIENLLESAGMGGKSCLLRAICETHESSLSHYGLLGELLTTFFSVSRSVFADSHLHDYLQAEKIGRKTRNCTQFFRECETTMFSWDDGFHHGGYSYNEDANLMKR